MDSGRDFLKAQVNNAIMQHRTLLENLEDHSQQAEDDRYRQLCERHLPHMQEHQQMLEDYGRTVGADGGGVVKETIGYVLGKARDTVDAVREDDFLRIVGDVVTIRQSQDTFATFAEVGQQIGEQRLAEIGRRGADDHRQMAEEFNDLTNQLFLERVRDMG
jgi:ferritin-like metal-binding protein YciE